MASKQTTTAATTTAAKPTGPCTQIDITGAGFGAMGVRWFAHNYSAHVRARSMHQLDSIVLEGL